MKMTSTLISLTLILIDAAVNSICAQSAFTYQGRLQNSGTNATGLYDLQFALFNSQNAGSQVGPTITRNAVPTTNGLFTVNLDFGAGMFDGSARWLQIGVKSNGLPAFTALSSRQQITPTPEAMYAQTAATVSTGAVSSAQLASDAVTSAKIANGQVVRSLNFLTDAVGIVPGEGLALNTVGNTLQLSLLPNCLTYSNCYWNLLGNGNITPGVNFLGTVAGETAPLEIRVNNTTTMRYLSSSSTPNIVGGFGGNSVGASVIGATLGGGGQGGQVNSIASDFGTIAGGRGNSIVDNASDSSVGGGSSNSVTGGNFPTGATIAGGSLNVVSAGPYNTIGGGYSNRTLRTSVAPESLCTISGGGGNRVSGIAATIGGGQRNRIAGDFGTGSTIGGGSDNVVGTGTEFGTVSGGQANQVGPFCLGSTIGGGANNNMQFQSTYGMISGGSLNAIFGGNHNNIGGGLSNAIRNASGTISFSSIGGGTWNIMSGNANYSAIGGGSNNVVEESAHGSTIGGGALNAAAHDAWYTTIAGGYSNRTTVENPGAPVYASIGGGYRNNVSGGVSTIAGGMGNDIGGVGTSGGSIGGGIGNNIGIESDVNTIGGGRTNIIRDQTISCAISGGQGNVIGSVSTAASIGGGMNNAISPLAAYATIPGGRNNTAFRNAFAAGTQAKAVNAGAFVWADSIGSDLTSTNDDSVTMRATGGYRLFSSAANGVHLAIGSGSWTALSDRNMKENFEAVTPREVLEKVAALPVQRWNYKTQDAAVRHIGPTAQDFKAAFEVGETDTGISTVDADGVALAAIQGLYEMLREKDAQLKELQKELKAVKEQLAK